MILMHLQAGNAITHLDALRLFGCARLAARVDDLRKQGHIIITEDVKQGTKVFGRYHLAKGK